MARTPAQAGSGENVSFAVIRHRCGKLPTEAPSQIDCIGFPSGQEACKISFNFYLNNIEYLKIIPMLATVLPLRNYVDFAPHPINPQRDAAGLGVLAAHGDECA
jgi:hypothetical protein